MQAPFEKIESRFVIVYWRDPHAEPYNREVHERAACHLIGLIYDLTARGMYAAACK